MKAAAGRIFLLRAPNRNVESRTLAKAAITAYLARMAEAGWVMAEVPDECTVGDILAVDADDVHSAFKRGFRAGYNACRAAMLGRDDPPRADVKQPPQIIEALSDE